MSSEWITVKLGTLISINSKSITSKSNLKTIEYIDTSSVTENQFEIPQILNIEDAPSRAKRLVSKGDTIISTVRPIQKHYGFIQDCKQNTVVSTGFAVVTPKKISPAYLYYFLTQEDITIYLNSIAESSTTTFPAFKPELLAELDITLPKDIKAQEDIGQILLNLENKILYNTKTNNTLETIAQTLFKSWFVDFDPVKAKIAAKEQGQDPQLAAMVAISGKTTEQIAQLAEDKRKELAATADLFPDEMVESELGLIPRGWIWTAFGELLDKTVGGDWGQDQPDDKHTEEVRIIRGTDIPTLKNGGLDKIPTRYVEKKKLASRKLELGDIVIEISGGSKDQPTGRSIYITQNILDRLAGVAEPASFCRLFRPIDEKVGLLLGIHLQYIYDAGKTWLYQNQSTGISNFQTTIFLENELISFASDDIINAFYNIVNPLVNKITSNENITLSTIRDSLLPQLLSGSLQID